MPHIQIGEFSQETIPALNDMLRELYRLSRGDGAEIPSGLIAMWSGAIANVPTGWHLCDGTEETPDLRDKFILSVSAEEEPGGTGGAHSKTLLTANLPAHTHGSTGNHSHGSKGAHTHYMRGTAGGALDSLAMGVDKNVPGYIPSSSAGAHTHSTTGTHAHSSVGSGTAFDNRPAFYKLAYIMKL